MYGVEVSVGATMSCSHSGASDSDKNKERTKEAKSWR